MTSCISTKRALYHNTTQNLLSHPSILSSAFLPSHLSLPCRNLTTSSLPLSSRPSSSSHLSSSSSPSCSSSLFFSPSRSFAAYHKPRPRSSSSSPQSKPVPLSSVLRQFYFLVHPDLFTAYPNHQRVNQENMQKFMAFITALKQTGQAEAWPAAQHHNLSFFVRKREGDGVKPTLTMEQALATSRKVSENKAGKVIEGQFHRMDVSLSTNGGNCKTIVERSLQHLFVRLNLPHRFTWDNAYFQPKPAVPRGSPGEEEQGDGGEEYQEEDEQQQAKSNKN